MFKANNLLEWTIYFFIIKISPFLLKIEKNLNIDDQKRKNNSNPWNLFL